MEKQDWQVEHEKKVKAREKGMKAMSDAQIEAVNLAYKSLSDTLQYIHDCWDLQISDVAKMEQAMWSLHHEFNKGEK
jgi:hypothetical protein